MVIGFVEPHPATVFTSSLSLSLSPSNVVTDNKGKTALFHCLHQTNRHVRCMDYLMECGADPNTVVRNFTNAIGVYVVLVGWSQ